MPKDGIKKEVVVDAVAEYADKILGLIADETEEGCQRLLNIADSAWESSKNHKSGKSSNLDHKVYLFKNAIPDLLKRLQIFKQLMRATEHSYNYFLFVEMLQTVPGYAFPTAKEMSVIIDRLKVHVTNKIDQFILDYQANLQLIERREAERKSIEQNLKKQPNSALIFNQLASAQTQAKAQGEKDVYALYRKGEMWELAWVDFAGKTYILTASEELCSLLVEHKVEDVEQVKEMLMAALKKQCGIVKNAFLDKTQLRINPELSDAELIAEGVSGVFVLRGKPENYSLSWINMLSKVIDIPLSNYPELEHYLNAHSKIAEQEINPIKVHLLHVNTNKSQGIDKFRTKLNIFFSKPAATKTEVVATKRLQMQKYGNIAALYAHKSVGNNPEAPKENLHRP